LQIEAQDADKRTAIHWAAFQGNYKMLKYFMDRGGDVAAKDAEGRTPLQLSTGAESSKCCKLLTKKMPPGMINEVDNDQMSALHWAAFHGNHKQLELLLVAGADVNLVDKEGKRAIHWTSGNKHKKAASKLLERDSALVEHVDNEGRTVLHLAIADSSTDVVKAVIKHCVASERQATLSLPDAMSRTPLHWAAVLGNAEVAGLLLADGYDWAAKDENGATAWHYCTQNTNSDCLATMIEFLGDQEPPDEVDTEGRTALMWAAGVGSVEFITMLASKNFDVHAVDSTGATALHTAAYAGHDEAVQTLLQYEATVDAFDSMKLTPMCRACEMGHAAVVITLLNANASPDLQDEDGRTAMHWAALGGFDYIVRKLIEKNANVDAQDSQGRTALQCAAYGGFIDVISVLCEVNANVNSQDSEGVSAMHWASSTGQIEAVKILSNHGAQLNSMEADGEKMTPLDYASLGDGDGKAHQDVVDYLIAKGAVTSITIKATSASHIQRAWRNYQGRKSQANGLAGVKGKKKGGKSVGEMASGAKNAAVKSVEFERELIAKNTAKVKELASSAVEREKLKRQRRIKERKERETELKKFQEERAREDVERQKQSAAVLLRSSNLHTTMTLERDRVTLFRRKQNAAITIQRHWRVWHYKQKKVTPTSKRTRRSPKKKARGAKDDGSSVKKLSPKIEVARIRRASVEVISAFQDFANAPLAQSVAALTIQLFWRQYKRRQIQRLTTEKKQTIREEMAEETRREKLKAKAIQKMKKEFNREAERRRDKSGRSLFPPAPLTVKTQLSEYRKRTAPRVYHAPRAVTMQRPSYLSNRPSPAESSFNFAVGNYSGFHVGNTSSLRSRSGSADATRSSSRQDHRRGSPKKLASPRSPEKLVAFAF
jgi:ankyrin repeat protein